MLPPVTQMLLIANVAVYVLQFALGNVLIAWFGLWPFHTPSSYGVSFMPWQVLALTAAAVFVIVLVASVLSIRKVLVVDPAIVFRG